MKVGVKSIIRAAVIGAALIGLGGCYYAPAPYAYAPTPAYGYYGGYYGPSVGVTFGEGGGYRHWR